MQSHSKKAILAALLANLGIAVAKFVGFAITGASSLLAEGFHSVADTGNQALLLLGGRLARRRATAEHPFGFGRERFFWAFVVAIVLFLLGAVFSLYEGVEKLRHPHPIESVGVAVGILVVAIVLESFSFRTAIVEANHVRNAESWWSFIRHSRAPELPVVILEDLGALVGLVLALMGVALTWITGDPLWDALATLAIGTLLGIIALVLAVEMKSLIIGEAARPEVVARVRDLIETNADVRRLIHMRTQHLGPDELLIGAKAEFDASLDIDEIATAINSLETHIRAEVAAARVIYIEPDVFHAAATETGGRGAGTRSVDGG